MSMWKRERIVRIVDYDHERTVQLDSLPGRKVLVSDERTGFINIRSTGFTRRHTLDGENPFKREILSSKSQERFSSVLVNFIRVPYTSISEHFESRTLNQGNSSKSPYNM